MRILVDRIRRTRFSQVVRRGVAIPQSNIGLVEGRREISRPFTYNRLLLLWILLFKHSSTATRDSALDAAWVICKCRALVRQSDAEHYCLDEGPALFMAGLILNEVEFSEGFSSRGTELMVVHAWIRKQLREGYFGIRWTREEVLVIFDEACRLSSFKDIAELELNGYPLLDYLQELYFL
jgi:hypothetical protein